MTLDKANLGPLEVCDPRQICPACRDRRRRRKNCPECLRTGYRRVSLAGLWNRPGFLVNGGPSINSLDTSRLQERGIVSLGVNNVAAHVPVDAWTFSDGQGKFHHGLWFDPKVMTFCPTPKLKKHVRVKICNEFRVTDIQCGQCPNTWGYQRSGRFYPDHFLDTWWAHWGYGGKQDGNRPFTRLLTMLIGLRLMIYLGCKTVYLLGADFWIDKQQPYAFNQAKGGGNNAWPKNEELLRLCMPALKRAGIEVFNCNPTSRLTLFPYVSYDRAIKHCKGMVPDKLDLRDWYTKTITRKFYDKYPEPLELGENLWK